MAKEIVFYDKGNITQLFPVTEASSVYTTTTGQTVRQELDTIIAKDTEQDNRLDALENNDVDLSSYYTKTEVDNANASQNIYIQGLDTRITEIENTEVYTKEETDTLLQGKENTLVSGTTIKTINGSSILGSGDIVLATDGLKIVKITQAEYDELTEYDPDVLYAISDSGDNTEIDLSGYYTKEETDTLLQGKENTLVSGTTIKTINGQDILGTGDITIESGGGLGIAEMTKEEYDNLTVYDPSTLYVISDSPSISELLARIEALETRITELGG